MLVDTDKDPLLGPTLFIFILKNILTFILGSEVYVQVCYIGKLLTRGFGIQMISSPGY